MTVSTVKAVLDADVDAQFTAVKGKLITLYQPKNGEGETGAWSFQSGILKDATGEVKITFKDREPVPQSMKGKDVYLVAYHGDKGWSGLYARNDEYKGVTKRVLWVTKTAELTVGAPPAQAASGPTWPSGYQPQAPKKAALPQAANSSGDPVRDARVFIAKRLAGNRITLRATQYLKEEWKAFYGEDMAADLFQSINAMLFISADRACMFDALPVTLTLNELGARSQVKVDPSQLPPEPEPTPPPPSVIEQAPDDLPMGDQGTDVPF